MKSSMFTQVRRQYHKKLCKDILGPRLGKKGVYSNADDSSPVSVELARGLAERLGASFCDNPPSAQRAGALFSRYTEEFLDEAFGMLQHIRPGSWRFSISQARMGIASFYQYEHLSILRNVLNEHIDLKASLGGDYLITPDIVVSRAPLSDKEINSGPKGRAAIVSVDDKTSVHTPLRAQNYSVDYQLLHASISCKWTMRSDRAQNTRTEALNLIRNRKGRAPNIVAVTFEPLPARLASLALGTGDIDCTYHGALHELLDAAADSPHQDALELLRLMVDGRRLRDISDLPFDLAT
jgi:hypothetical protein